MGRDGRGVRAVSESSIEITFMYRGVRCRERISLKPTATNLKRAEQHKAAVEHAIANGTFDYAVTFPGSPRAAKFAPEASQETVAGFLTKWLACKKQHVSSSTFEGYRKLVELRMVPALGPYPAGRPEAQDRARLAEHAGGVQQDAQQYSELPALGAE